jgi:hypothetical protein
MVSSPAVLLSFVVGSAHDVFAGDLARAVDAALKKRYPLPEGDEGEPYRSDEVDARGWVVLQNRVPRLAAVDAYQAVFVPSAVDGVEEITVENLADPFHVSSLQALVDALGRFAAATPLPTDDVELMQLAARYLEDDALFDQDLDVQTYVQLMLSAKQAMVRRQRMWIVS